jgi:hypothetical protein
MITAACDRCGSKHDVKAPFITLWNGHTIDLCGICMYDSGLVKILDGIFYRRRKRQRKARRRG